MARQSFTSQLRQFVAVVSRSGITDGERLVLRELGLRTLESMSYPGIARDFTVEFDPVWRWIGRGVREPGVLKFVTDSIREGMTVFDIGAHVGEWTMLFSALVGPAGRVVSFEPDPVARSSLKRNLGLNGISNVTVEAFCVSDTTGKALLSAERFGSGLSSIVRPRAGGVPRLVLEVDSTTLDRYCEDRGLYPEWIKVDAEGAEPHIVRGMSRLIDRAHPSVILEFHSEGLTNEEKARAWSTVVARASTIQFLQSRRRDHFYLESLPPGFSPDCGFLVVYIKY